MSDQPTSKKIVINRSQLPPISSDGTYSIRYRVVSEDRNRASHWSPIFRVRPPKPAPVNGEVAQSGNIFTVVWDMPEGGVSLFDVFVKNDGGEFSYAGTTEVLYFAFRNTASSAVQVVVQASSIDKTLNENLQIFDSGQVFLV